MKKYWYMMGIEVKNTLVYRGDIWLTAIFSVFSVVLAYLLWSAVFGDSETFNGFTLSQMITYYLLSGILSPLTQSDGLLSDFSAEIKGGSYSKYMVKPLSPLGYFLAVGFARTLFPGFASTMVLSLATISFDHYFEAIRFVDILRALPVILLGAILSMLIGYIISMATFRFTEAGFIYLLHHIIKSFLGGALIPLSLFFGDGAPMWSPFSYTLYYPVMLCMGKSDLAPLTAVVVLSVWVAIALAASLIFQRTASRTFEGVGL